MGGLALVALQTNPKGGNRLIPVILKIKDGTTVVVDRSKDMCLYRRTQELINNLPKDYDGRFEIVDTIDIYIHISRSGNVYFYFWSPSSMVNRWGELYDYDYEHYELTNKLIIQDIVLDIISKQDRLYLNGLDFELAKQYLDASLFEETG